MAVSKTKQRKRRARKVRNHGAEFDKRIREQRGQFSERAFVRGENGTQHADYDLHLQAIHENREERVPGGTRAYTPPTEEEQDEHEAE